MAQFLWYLMTTSAVSPSNNKINSDLQKPYSESAGAREQEIKRNELLAALPDNILKEWLVELELTDMPLGKVLYESGSVEKNVYFPISAIVSLLYVMENGDSAEIAIVGNEGVVGISLYMGGNSTPSRAVVQSAGKG